MIESMTGFGSRIVATPQAKVCAEIRSLNHKFLEIVLHLPEGQLALEDKVKKEIEARIRRGRVTCVVTLMGKASPRVRVNEELLEKYCRAIRTIEKRRGVGDSVSADTLVNLPGVLLLEEDAVAAKKLWPSIQKAVAGAVEDLAAMRVKEGTALAKFLASKLNEMEERLAFIADRFKKVIKEKTPGFKTESELTLFLNSSDVTEELERLGFYVKNFRKKLSAPGPAGKEMDFIAQEMQREANTIGAKSCDLKISEGAVQVKSLVEKLREQLQNIE